MLFELDVLQDGQHSQIVFDNLTNVFSDKKTGLEFLKSSRVTDYLRGSDDLCINRHNIGNLTITLGLNCNFHCKYCHQNAFRKTSEVVHCTPERAENLLRILEKANLRPKAVSLWGGEPLVYWKAIKILVPGLRKLYPKVRIGFPTNGALLTEEKLRFFDKWKVHFSISYDGKSSNRDKSIFDDASIRDYFRKTQKPIDIVPTQNRASIPIKAIISEFREMDIRLRSVSTYSIARCNPYNRDQAAEIMIPQAKVKESADFIYDVLHGRVDHPELYEGLRDRFDFLVSIFYRGEGADSTDCAFCGNVSGYDVTIDADGTIFNCMNIPVFKLGNILDPLHFDVSHVFQSQLKKKTCLECPFLSTCKGGCPLIHDDQSIEFKANCNNLKAIAVPMFRTVVEALLGVYLKKITRCSDGMILGEF